MELRPYQAEARRADRVRLFALMDDVEGTAYPVRLYPLPEEERQKLVESLNYMRRYSVWSLLAIFLSLSVFGWLWEVGLFLVSYGVLANRGSLHGPWLPIYGSGAILILFVTLPAKDHLWLVWLLGMIAATALEYVTGAAMEALFKVRYWDYSKNPLNVRGYICLTSSLAWGAFSILLVRFLHPPVEDLVLALPGFLTDALACVLTVCTTADGHRPLAARLRESGMTVIGMGESKTPNSFIASCNKFKYLDILSAADEEEPEDAQKPELPKKALQQKKSPSRKTASQKKAKDEPKTEKEPKASDTKKQQKDIEEPRTSLRTIRRALRTIVRENSDEDNWIIIGKVGNILGKRYPDFDVRNFGFSKLTPFLDSLDMFEIKSERKDSNSSPQMYVRLK